MKINELRNLLAESREESIKKAFAECYKALPKAKKEEIDGLLTDILKGSDVKKAKKKNQTVDFGELSVEIDTFMEYAYADLYFAPNKIVPRAQRSKWRFTVKGFVKALTAVKEEDESFGAAAEYLFKLYELLCYGCGYYVFSSTDTFRSVGIPQEEFLEMVVSRKLAAEGYTKENLERLIWLGAACLVSSENLNEDLLCVVADKLKTSDSKYIAIEAARALIETGAADELTEKSSNPQTYDVEYGKNRAALFILHLAVLLGETESYVAYYFSAYKSRNKEYTLSRALWRIKDFGTDRDWITVYEYAVKKIKVKPAEHLKKEYNELKSKMKA
ncbi:MAG: hypothetical protein LUD81_07815 [Clostridiales bacterium]|nr:hypothetical protein [Clostridiales bacterium]